MDMVLKVACQGEVHRLSLGLNPDYNAVEVALRKLWPNIVAGSVKYIDPEGDLCTFVEGTFSDFLATSKLMSGANERCVLKLVILDHQMRIEGHDALEKPALAALGSARRRLRRSAPMPVAKDSWKEDGRDLEQLLRQIGHEDADDSGAVARAKRKRPKAKRTAARLGAKHSSAMGTETAVELAQATRAKHEEEEEPDQNRCLQQPLHGEHSMVQTPMCEPKAVDFIVDEQGGKRYLNDEAKMGEGVWVAVTGVEEDANVVKCLDEEEWQDVVGETHIQQEQPQDGGEDSIPSVDDEQDQLKLPFLEPGELKRSSSCPCPLTWLAQCRPIEDEERLSGEDLELPAEALSPRSNDSMDPYSDRPPNSPHLWPATPESTPPPSPRHMTCYQQQQVVWVPYPMWVPMLPEVMSY